MEEVEEGVVPKNGVSETAPMLDHIQPRTESPESDTIPPLGMAPLDVAPAFPADEAVYPEDDTDEVAPPTNETGAVWARGLTREFEPGVGVFDLDLDIPRGSIFGFIGPSGSGKTTTMRLLTGVIAPESGELSVLGRSPLEFDRLDRSELGYMPQLSVLYPELSLTQNLRFVASLFGVPWRGRSRKLREMLEFVDLYSSRRRLLRNASGGMQRRLALAATLIHDPLLLFLDEPTAGLDPVLRRKFWDRFAEFKEQGRTIFVTTQYVGEAAYCDKVGILANGRMLTIDTPEGLRRQSMGGEALDVAFAEPLDTGQLNRLVELTKAMRWEARGPGAYRLIVDDAGDVAADIGVWATSSGLTLESVEPFLPPFDDVFVDLVSRLTPDEEAKDG